MDDFQIELLYRHLNPPAIIQFENPQGPKPLIITKTPSDVSPKKLHDLEARLGNTKSMEIVDVKHNAVYEYWINARGSLVAFFSYNAHLDLGSDKVEKGQIVYGVFFEKPGEDIVIFYKQFVAGRHTKDKNKKAKGTNDYEKFRVDQRNVEGIGKDGFYHVRTFAETFFILHYYKPTETQKNIDVGPNFDMG